MNSGQNTTSKQQKIDNIMALLSGVKKPEDLFPDCVMMIGYGDEDHPHFYQVNERRVSREVYDRAVASADYKGCCVTYGQLIPGETIR